MKAELEQDLTRRQTLGLMAGSAVMAALSLAGCGGIFGGSGDDGTGTQSNDTKSVTVPFKLPAGFGVPATQLAGETLFDSQPLGSGTFKSTMLVGSRPVAAFLRDTKADKYVLGGIAGAGTAGVSALGSAVLLIAISSGVFNLPVALANNIVTQLEKDPAVQALANVIETRLKADPYALFGTDPAIDAALHTAYAALTPTAKTGIVPPPQTSGTTDLLLIHEGDQSMARVVQAATPGAITIYNLGRRPMTVYVYRIADADANGVRTDLPEPELISGPTEVQATYSIVNAVIHLRSAYTPLKGPTIDLPVHPGKSTTFYEVVILMASAVQSAPEPAFFLGPRYVTSVETWRKELGDLNVEAGIGGVLYGFLQAAIGGSFSQFAPRAVAAALAAHLRALEAGLIDTAVQQLLKSDFQGAIKGCLIAFNGAKREALRTFLETVPESVTGGTAITTIRSTAIRQAGIVQAAASLALRAISTAGAILSVADWGFTAADLYASSRGEKWSITAVTPKVKITPTSKSVPPSVTLPFTASITNRQPGTKFTYIWTLTGGSSSLLSDRSVTPPKVARDIETDSPTVTLIVSPSEVDTTVLTVEVEALLVEGQPGHQTFTSVGKAQAKVTVDTGVVLSHASVQVSGVDGSIANQCLPTSFDVPRVGAMTYSNNPGGSHLGVNFGDNSLNSLSVSIDAPGEFAVGQTFGFGSGAGLRVEYFSKINGFNNDNIFVQGTGSLTITQADGRVIGFTATGHMPLLGYSAGATVKVSGVVQVG